jgi:hypothetical protein
MISELTKHLKLSGFAQTRPAVSRKTIFRSNSSRQPCGVSSFLPVLETPLAFMRKNLQDITGQTFGTLTALCRTESSGNTKWECNCRCGKVMSIRISHLLSGARKSCGCLKAPEDLTGQRFQRLTAIRLIEGAKKAKWLCQCDCGETPEVYASSLKNSHTGSCGCLHRAAVTTHGDSSNGSISAEYRTWSGMVNRATSEVSSAKDYPKYRGRGIKVCDRWRVFENFLSDMGRKPTPSHSLDRIDNDGSYCPENCRWATRSEQQRNTRSNRLLTYKGETRCLTEWAEVKGVRRHVLNNRVRLGWTTEQILETPVMPRKPRATPNV